MRILSVKIGRDVRLTWFPLIIATCEIYVSLHIYPRKNKTFIWFVTD